MLSRLLVSTASVLALLVSADDMDSGYSACECGEVSSETYAAIENAFAKHMVNMFILGGSSVSDEQRGDTVASMNQLLTSDVFWGRQEDPEVQWHNVGDVLTHGVEWMMCGCDFSAAISTPVVCAMEDNAYVGAFRVRSHLHETFFQGEGEERALVHNPAIYNAIAHVSKDSEDSKPVVRFSQVTWINMGTEFE